jgi:hypothetical protein
MSLDVGDEGVGKHGACSWMLAVDDRWSPYGSDTLGRSRRNLRWDWLLLVVRDLKMAVPSVILENRHATGSFAYRRKHIRRRLGIDIATYPDETARALCSIVSWVRIIAEQAPHLAFRIEDQQPEMRKFVAARLAVAEDQGPAEIHDNSDKPYGGMKREKPEVSADDWKNMPEEMKVQVRWYCSKFGYNSPID